MWAGLFLPSSGLASPGPFGCGVVTEISIGALTDEIAFPVNNGAFQGPLIRRYF